MYTYRCILPLSINERTLAMSTTSIKSRLTWGELNSKINGMIEDIVGPQFYDFMEEGGDEEYIFNCQALEFVVEALHEITTDPECPEDYTEVIREIKAAL